MRNQRTLVNPSPSEVCQGMEMRRRVADCRERLRRNRTARRITERAPSHTYDFAEQMPEPAHASAAYDVREEET
ncbi:MAG: hypothetical protein QOC61_1063 [Acidobacteriota bacterium]|jgi:hypothetical protein|nr:hypothetical protein [Acidobacteriota bacterium]